MTKHVIILAGDSTNKEQISSIATWENAHFSFENICRLHFFCDEFDLVANFSSDFRQWINLTFWNGFRAKRDISGRWTVMQRAGVCTRPCKFLYQLCTLFQIAGPFVNKQLAEAWYHSSQIQQDRITFYLLLSTSHLTPSPFNRRGDPFIQICMIWRQTLFLNLSSCLKRFEWKKNPVEKAKIHESCKDYSSTSANRKVIWKIDLKKCILENNSSHLTGVSSEPFRFSSWLIHSWWNILLPQNF